MKIVFCLPGTTYSREFLLAWTELMMQVSSKGHQIMVAQNPSRVGCIANGDAAPFHGQDYDAAMWIGQDTIFRSEDFFNLLASPHDVTAGMYMNENLQNFEIIKEFSPDFPNGKFMRPDDIIGSSQYVQVAYSGMNWMLIRKGIFEKIAVPYIWNTKEDSEEMNFCKMVGEVYIDTKIRVGNQKRIIV